MLPFTEQALSFFLLAHTMADFSARWAFRAQKPQFLGGNFFLPPCEFTLCGSGGPFGGQILTFPLACLCTPLFFQGTVCCPDLAYFLLRSDEELVRFLTGRKGGVICPLLSAIRPPPFLKAALFHSPLIPFFLSFSLPAEPLVFCELLPNIEFLVLPFPFCRPLPSNFFSI